MEVRPLPQQRHPLMHTPPIRPPQQQQMAVPHPQPALVPSFSQSQQQSPAHLLQPMQPLQQLQSMQQQQAHYGIAPRPSSLTGSMTPGNLAPPLIGQKRESSGFPHALSQAADSSDSGNIAKLFVGCLPRSVTEDEVQRIFADYGKVLELAMIKERRPGVQHGICFVKYGSIEEAERAIRALHNKRTLPGGTCPLQVRFADAERERPGTEQKLFVGSLSKLATEKDIEEIFAPYGRVDDVYIMRDEYKQSRGCAFVKYPSRDMAMAAITALNNVYKMLGCDQPITVRFADPKRPRSGDTRVGGPGFGGPNLNPQPGHGSIVPRPSSIPSGYVGARNPYWRPVGGPGMGSISQGGLRPYGAAATALVLSEGPPTVVTPPTSEVSGSISGSPHTAGVVSPQVGGPGMLGTLSQQQGHSQQLFQRQSYVQFQQLGVTPPQGRQVPLQALSQQQSQPVMRLQTQSQPQLQSQHQQQQQLLPAAAIQHQHPQGQLQSLQQPLQAYPQVQSIDSASHQAPYGQVPSAQVSVQPYGQMVSQQQVQQQLPFSAQQAIPAIHIQQSQVQPVQQYPYSIQQLPSLQPIQSHQYQQQLQSQQAPQASQQQILPVQPVAGQLQNNQQHQLHMFQQPLQQHQTQPLQSLQTPQQAYFQVALPSPQQQTSTQPSWALAQPQQVATSVGISVTPVGSTAAPSTVTCNWTEHTSPEGHKYYYNSITGESRWEKPEEFAAYEHHQQQNQPLTHVQVQGQAQPQPQVQGQVHGQIQVQAQQQQLEQQQYGSSTAVVQQPVQGMAYVHSQSTADLVDPARAAQRIPPAQQLLPSVQEWMWKMKPAGL
eukprot:c28788_g1_i3 orf=510-2993(-)